MKTIEEAEDIIADILSDEFGWCVVLTFKKNGPKTTKQSLRTTNSSLSYKCDDEKQLKHLNKQSK